MKCLDKKRIKMKQGETLALNERIMLSLVSTGVRGLGRGTRLAPWSRVEAARGVLLGHRQRCLTPSLVPGLPVHRVYVVCLPHA